MFALRYFGIAQNVCACALLSSVLILVLQQLNSKHKEGLYSDHEEGQCVA